MASRLSFQKRTLGNGKQIYWLDFPDEKVTKSQTIHYINLVIGRIFIKPTHTYSICLQSIFEYSGNGGRGYENNFF